VELTVIAQKRLGAFSLDADFTIQGDKIGVFGPSGGGKSTMVSLIAGLNKPDRGSILLDGEPLFDSRKGLNVPPEHRRIGMVFQRPHLFPHLSTKGNLLYGYKRCTPENRKIKFDSLVEILQISHLLDRGVRYLSGGEKQRVAIGRTVLSNPRLLLMDEPLSALDDSLKFQIIPFLKNACDIFKIPYLFISHSLLEMRVMTSRVLMVADGRVTGQAEPEDLARDRMKDATGYTNLLRLGEPRRVNDVYAYRWGDRELFIADNGAPSATFFELSSRDVILFKRHPEAISARNLFKTTVISTFDMGVRMGVELRCGSEKLVAEVTKKAANQMEIKEGTEVYAAIKALSFKRLG